MRKRLLPLLVLLGAIASLGAVSQIDLSQHVKGTLATARLTSTMQAGTLLLFPGGFGPDGTSGNLTAALAYETSTASATSNGPKVFQQKLLFDGGSTDEYWMFAFQLPPDYSSGGTLRGVFKMTSATSGNIVASASIVCSTNASSDDDGLAFNTVTTTGATSVPGTQGQTKEFTIALTTTGMAANRSCKGFIGRDASDTTNDTATGDLELISMNLEYTRQ